MKYLLKRLPGLLLLGLFGCGAISASPEIYLAVVNKSSFNLENVRARFGSYGCMWGYVGKTFTKSQGVYSHPITEEAELHWEEGGKGNIWKITTSGVYKSGTSGALTFTVYDKEIEVSFKDTSGKVTKSVKLKEPLDSK